MRKPKHPVGRFARASIVDRGVDVVQRWWPIMTAIFTGALTLYAKLGAFFTGFGWLDALVAGFIGSVFLTCGVLWAIVGYRMLRPTPLPVHDRQEFVDEVIRLADLVGGQEPAIYNKKFTRCVIEGPGLVNFVNNNDNIYPSTNRKENLVMADEGSPAHGTIGIVRCWFERCHFQNLTIVATPKDMAAIKPTIEIMSLGDWEDMRWPKR